MAIFKIAKGGKLGKKTFRKESNAHLAGIKKFGKPSADNFTVVRVLTKKQKNKKESLLKKKR